MAAHVRANTRHTRAIAAAAAEALAPINNAPGRAMTTDEIVQDLAKFICDRLNKGKNQEGRGRSNATTSLAAQTMTSLAITPFRRSRLHSITSH